MKTYSHADSGRQPKSGRSGYSAQFGLFKNDYTCADKTHSGHDLRSNPRRIKFHNSWHTNKFKGMNGNNRKKSRAKRNQGKSAYSGLFASKFTLKAYKRA